MTFEIVYGMLRISCSMRTGDSVGAFYVFPYISGKTEPTSDIIRTFVTLNIIRMKTKKKDSFMDYIKANRKGSREAEIENHGHPVSFNRVHVSKKVYNRKRDKKVSEKAAFFFCYAARLLSIFIFKISLVFSIITFREVILQK